MPAVTDRPAGAVAAEKPVAGGPVVAGVVEAVAGLGAAIDRVAGVRLAALGGGALRGHVQALEVARTRLEAQCLAAVRALDERGVWAEDGAANAGCWLAAGTGQARAEAGSRVAAARALPRMPLAASALASGAITLSHVRVLARGLGPRTAARFAADEGLLVGHARRHTADELARIMGYWLAHADDQGAEPPGGDGDEVQLSRTLDRWVLRGSFGPETGAEVAAAVAEKVQQLLHQEKARAEVDPGDPTTGRSAAARRAAALVDLVTAGAAAGPETRRRRPAITALIDWRTLFNHTKPNHGHGGNGHGGNTTGPGVGPVHELDDGTVMPRWLVRLWSCDSDISRAVLGAGGEILELGRTVRTASPAQRRALAARDRGCVVPGCDRPPGWCDAHHLQHWDHGGPTDLDNLALLCRHHHRRIHAGHLTIHMHTRRPVVCHPDGTPLHHPRRPPPPPPPP